MSEIIKFSNPMKPGQLDEAYAKGMLRISDLKDRQVYQGYCRNARAAMWIEEISQFIYVRDKFSNLFLEKIQHPENDDGYDLFIPISITTVSERDKPIFDKELVTYIAWAKKYSKN